MNRKSKIKEKDVDEFLKNNKNFAKKWFKANLDNLGTIENEAEEETVTEEDELAALNYTTAPSRNSITTNMFRDIVEGRRRYSSPVSQRRKIALENLGEKELFMELIREIANELDVNALCHKILINVGILAKSDRGSLFLVRGSRVKRYLVSKLFDVTATSYLEDVVHTDNSEITVPFGVGIAGTVAETKQPINIKDAYEDPRFNQEIDKMTGFRTKSLLCMPILNYEGEVIGVAQIMNKQQDSDSTVFTNEDERVDGFTKFDEQVFSQYLTFCGIGLTNAQLFETSVQEYKKNEMLLTMAKNIFEEQQNLTNLVQRIMGNAQRLIKCERLVVYLVDDSMDSETENLDKHKSALKALKNDHRRVRTPIQPQMIIFSHVFELNTTKQGDIVTLTDSDVESSKNAQWARSIAVTGEDMHIDDINDLPQSKTEEMEDHDGFKIRGIMAVPIRNNSNRVIGIVQLLNKIDRKMFSDSDVNLVKALSIFFGLGVHNCRMYEDACTLMAKQSVALECLSYHAAASQEETDKLLSEISTSVDYNLYSFGFSDFNLTDYDTVKATVRMFIDCGVTKRFSVSYEKLCRWTLSVKKNYRPVTYHNWRHAFNVTQTMFTMIFTGKKKKVPTATLR